MALVNCPSDTEDSDEPLASARDRRRVKARMRRYFASARAERDSSQESDVDPGTDLGTGQDHEQGQVEGKVNTAAPVESDANSETERGVQGQVKGKADTAASASKRACRKAGLFMPPEVRERIEKAECGNDMKHAVAVNLDDAVSGAVLYDPDSRTVYRGFADVLRALTDTFDAPPELLDWVQLFVESPEHGLIPWCSCSIHLESSERLSPLRTPKVRARSCKLHNSIHTRHDRRCVCNRGIIVRRFFMLPGLGLKRSPSRSCIP
jgi:hypothetical protein